MEHIHLIGIGGSGLSAIARVLLESGYTVSGSDRLPSAFTASLEEAGAAITIGHQAENVAGANVVVRSSAVPDDNPEVRAALNANIPVLKRTDFLGRLLGDGRYKTIAVAGTHGKTTTTAMIAWTLSQLGRDPSFIIGGVSKNLGTNAHAGKGVEFVIEADEYDHMFMGLKPDIIVVSNVDYDHPDCYPTREDYDQAFADFTSNLRPGGKLLVCAEDSGAQRLGQNARIQGKHVLAYGLDHLVGYEADYKTAYTFDRDLSYLACDLNRNQDGCFDYQAWFQPDTSEGSLLAQVKLQVPGIHNVLNSLAAIGVCHCLELAPAEAALPLHTFQGAGRRFDLLGEAGGIVIINDYAHHPTEIHATLSAARVRFPGQRLWAVWQPHTLTRTQVFLSNFETAFADADQVVITGIYGARENVDPQVETNLITELVQSISGPATHYIANHHEVVAYLAANLLPGDVVLVLSAGDGDLISEQLLDSLRS